MCCIFVMLKKIVLNRYSSRMANKKPPVKKGASLWHNAKPEA
ncbi:hypothetical protein D088_720042 [Salmonella enterica subsp. houtenae serovar 16:z4,z32:-- str. RKS3027]|nr:hypothetical protein D088_720042 [Salmonella enterica subsp. houtenae serovar 16:z4,z32:-- str. RKS3027]